MAAKKRASFTVKAGSVELPVYFRELVKGGRRYEEWTLVFFDAGGKRCRRFFADREKAQAEAERIASALSRGQAEAVEFTAADAEKYGRAIRLLKPTGVPLVAAVEEYVDARGKLPNGVSLGQAAQSAAEKHRSADPRPVGKVADELARDREAAGCSEEHVRDIRKRLAPFANAFNCPIASVSPPLVREYLATLRGTAGNPLSGRSRDNARRMIVTLFNFARQQRYVPRELAEEIAEIPAPVVKPAETGVFTPAQIATILEAAEGPERALIAIAAFCGVRTAELQRLSWEDVQMAERVVIIRSEKAKTASRRTIEMPPNLVEWLQPFRGSDGTISPHSHEHALAWVFMKIARGAGVQWVKNGLRHSFCSYRLAVTKNAATVAHEAGNSPAVVHRHYSALVTEAQGQAWFDIRPAKQENVITLPMEAAG